MLKTRGCDCDLQSCLSGHSSLTWANIAVALFDRGSVTVLRAPQSRTLRWTVESIHGHQPSPENSIVSSTVSVVIPAFRAAHTIQRCVESVLVQTATPHDVVVVDDGSPDGDQLAAIIDSFGSPVRLVKKANGGASSARNLGIEQATSEWVAFLDADDYWERTKLERQLGIAKQYPDVAVVGCRWYTQEPGGHPTPSATGILPYCDRLLRLHGRAAFEVALLVWTGSLMIRRAALKNDQFVPGLEPAEDRDLWIRLLAAHPTYIVSELLATYVQEPGGISRTNVDRDCGNMLRVVERHSHLLGRAGHRLQTANVHKRWASGHLAQGRPAKALPHAIRRLLLQPTSVEGWWIVAKSLARTLIHTS